MYKSNDTFLNESFFRCFTFTERLPLNIDSFTPNNYVFVGENFIINYITK